jgi:hypothetical protein
MALRLMAIAANAQVGGEEEDATQRERVAAWGDSSRSARGADDM